MRDRKRGPDATRALDGSNALAPGRRSLTDGLVQRKAEPGAAPTDGVRERVEVTTGADLSGVRVHDDAAAAVASSALGAKAFTRGNDVYFGAGQHAPGSVDGDRLLAHELVHTVQQRGGATTQTKLEVSQPGDAAELEADRVAEVALAGTGRATVSEVAPMIQREPAAAPARGDAATDAQAAPLEAEIRRKLDVIVAEVLRIRGRVNQASRSPGGTIKFPARNEEVPLATVVAGIVDHHNQRVDEAMTDYGAGVAAADYHLAGPAVAAALAAPQDYGAEDWNAWAGGQSGQWKDDKGNKYELDEVWQRSEDLSVALPSVDKARELRGVWQSAQWFHHASHALEKVGFNLTLHADGVAIVLGFDPKSDEASAAGPMDLAKPANIEKGAHAGYPFQPRPDQRCIAWVTGSEAFCESLITLPDGRRIKLSGGMWGAGRWQYDG